MTNSEKAGVLAVWRSRWLSSLRHKDWTQKSNCFRIHRSAARKDYSQVENIQDSCQSSVSGCPSKFSPKSDCAALGETAKSPGATSDTLQASVCMLNIKVRESSTEERQKPQNVCKQRPLDRGVQRVDVFATMHVWIKPNGAHQHERLTPSVTTLLEELR